MDSWRIGAESARPSVAVPSSVSVVPARAGMYFLGAAFRGERRGAGSNRRGSVGRGLGETRPEVPSDRPRPSEFAVGMRRGTGKKKGTLSLLAHEVQHPPHDISDHQLCVRACVRKRTRA